LYYLLVVLRVEFVELPVELLAPVVGLPAELLSELLVELLVPVVELPAELPVPVLLLLAQRALQKRPVGSL
jgi:hypothetical protein